MHKEWSVLVEGVGYIGTVQETTEELARCAALAKYHADGERTSGDKRLAIYEDDEISVSTR